MYGKWGGTTLATTPVGVVAFSSMDALWYVVAACTLLAAGFAMARLVPRRRRRAKDGRRRR